MSLTELEEQEIITRITNLICDEAMGRDKIIQVFLNEGWECQEESINELIDSAIDKLNLLYSTPEYRRSVMEDHISKYELIYAYLREAGYTPGSNKALQAKERLMDVLKEGNKVTVRNSEITITETGVSHKYDLTKLTEVERARLQFLMEKAR
ncbi:hypothetical protein [Flavihumibacter profundi]|uniref:hypothetical protein n=1 Tax=Flavihumibacter profundi TaxID=2716883 RepID=UPI001CC3B632|nr:hypothetical protein [Flavihumibacter profundi]MBZ5859445.1 hypothetical protein [Flavihumibacter profundi]